ncbi:mast cell carboxypeptidase A-like [Spea bombifrons]|uniref:mast cell carboxypeptidase A-like n=1 Tax=Spea bombifrons TaxID=233779 RepID=UPI00234B5087|nr:mast cell carboxypeptidase A-like [Spea bombifrons]
MSSTPTVQSTPTIHRSFAIMVEVRQQVIEKVFRVIPKNEEEVLFIKYLGSVMQLDFWKPRSSDFMIPDHSVDFRAGAEEAKAIIHLLDQKEIKYKILLENVQDIIEEQFKKSRILKDSVKTPKYLPWEKISMWAYSISLKNPKLVSYVEIGNTYEGRPMILLKIGSQKANKKIIVLECGTHAREWISPAFCQWFVNEAVRTYGKDKSMTRLLDTVTFHVLPVFNIDGYVWTWTEDRMWRKNRKPNDKCVGTDLNRNFNISWNSVGTSDNPCYDDYAGSGPVSEVETQALTAYIRENLSSIKAYISFHSYGQMLMYPYGFTKKKPPNHKKLKKISGAAVKALSGLYGTNYTYGPIASTIYQVSGSSIDWTYEEGIKYSFVFELRDDDVYGFLLPEYLIKPTCKETILAVKVIANYATGLDT